MRPRNLEEEAAAYRVRVQYHVEQAESDDVIALFWKSPAGSVVRELLHRQVETWESSGCWSFLDDETKREQGKALRSRELLEYFNGAEESAKVHREEAMRLSTLVENAANQGRISRT